MGKKAEKTKENILKTAIEEFASSGFAGVRVDVIASKASVNKERIFCYFKSKLKLYEAVIEYAYKLITDAEQPLLSLTINDASSLTENIVKLYFDFHAKHPEFSRLLAWENLKKFRLNNKPDDSRSIILSHLEGIYKEGQKNGVFREAVSFESYFLTISAISFFYFSNMSTMSETLNLNLSSNVVKKRIMKECVALIQ